jgi:hypothetical protein
VVRGPSILSVTCFKDRDTSSERFFRQKDLSLADGSTVPSMTFVIRSLKVGNHLLENVTGSVASVQLDFIHASEEEAEARLSEQRVGDRLKLLA